MPKPQIIRSRRCRRPTTPQDVLVDGWVGKKVDKGMTVDTEHVDINFVSIGFKASICRPESREHAGDQIEAQFSRVRVLEQAIRRAGVHTRDQIDDCFASPQHNGHRNRSVRHHSRRNARLTGVIRS